MTDIEGSEGHNESDKPNPHEGFALIANPFDGEQPQIRHTADGGFTIFLRGEIHIVYQPPAADALESPVPGAETSASGLLPDSTPPPVTEQHSASDSASPPPSETADQGAVEQGNELHTFTGNPTYDAAYWELKTGKRVAEFVLATHPDEGETEYKRIRSFDGLAAYVRDNVRKGQKDVFVEAWGPKQWKTRHEKQMTGYYAKKVKVPKKYLPKQSD
jgi:hypothetical protein